MRRTRRLIVAAAVALVLTLIALTYRLFVWPQTDSPRRVDAVVVFAGGDGERQAEGARLVRDGVAPVLVISDGGRPDSSKYRICQQPEGPSLLLGGWCLSPRGVPPVGVSGW